MILSGNYYIESSINREDSYFLFIQSIDICTSYNTNQIMKYLIALFLMSMLVLATFGDNGDQANQGTAAQDDDNDSSSSLSNEGGSSSETSEQDDDGDDDESTSEKSSVVAYDEETTEDENDVEDQRRRKRDATADSTEEIEYYVFNYPAPSSNKS